MKEIILLLACIVGLLAIWDQARRYGLSYAWQAPLLIIVLTIPMVLYFPVRSLLLDCRMILAMFVALLLFRQPAGFFTRWKPVPSDAMIFILFAVLISSEISNRTITPFGTAQVLLQWVPPYLLGRLCLTESRDLRYYMQGINIALVVWSAVSVIEGLSHTNLWAKIAGIVTEVDIVEVRFGMKRAYGSQLHPISWGVTLVMFLPFQISAARLAKEGEGPRWWIAAPWLMLPGYLATGSRAVQMMVLIILVSNLYYLFPRIRPGVLFGGLALAIMFLGFREEVVDLLASTVEDTKKQEFIVIRGELHQYSGTKHRDLLFKVYEDAINSAGWLGFGNPLQNVPLDPYVDDRFVSVDNHFLHCYLHNGLLGLIFFCLFCATMLGNLLYVTVKGGPELGLSITSLGCMIGMLITFRTLWLDMNFGWFFLFFAGVTGSLANATSRQLSFRPYHDFHVER